jgi:UDP-N-acetylmuramyl tripeptide synthase
MMVSDSRRLTGFSLILDRPGAVLDVRLEEAQREQAITAWRRHARAMMDALGWTGETLAIRPFPGGVSLALSAPVDALYVATDVNEWAWEAATAELEGEARQNFAERAEAFRARMAAEANPALLALRDAAQQRGVTFLSDDDGVSVGSGTGVLVWPPEAVPAPAQVDWFRVHDVPIVLVTGSNGKTTVVRLIAAMVSAGNTIPGVTSTDGVRIGSELVAEGDFSGPSGARLVLRSAKVGTAVLETARGGILRRGLAVDHADVAVVTNVAEDHLGEFGVQSLSDLAETKMLVAKALGRKGTLVLNADNRLLVEQSRKVRAAITWFSLDPSSPIVMNHLQAGGTAVLAEDDRIVIARGSERTPLTAIADLPITFGGSAPHNVANALAAVAAGIGLRIPAPRMDDVLRRFGREIGDNPGRANLFDLGGARVLLDYAHNPDGMSALVRVAKTLPANRRLVMIGQAGDRDDEAIRELARVAWLLQPDHIVVNEMDQYLRGRSMGEVPTILADEFLRLGMPDAAISRVGPEVDGVLKALDWARPGDLLVLTIHQDRGAVLGLLNEVAASRWRAGEPVPREFTRV